jgi:3-oxoacyl-[acyl-carrier-protein] synthase II
MSPDRCKPFDKDRQGMQLGEAAAFLMLENEDVARERNAKIYGYVGNLGLSCDAYHPTAPQPEGNGMAQAMLNALQQADLNPIDIDWLCAHGTGTKLSDTAECIAINKVFSADIPVVGVKGSLGHSLGAASAVEAVICAMALHKKCLPPTVGANNLDPQLSVNVVRDSITFDTAQYVMNCAYGFGGVNSALILQAS